MWLAEMNGFESTETVVGMGVQHNKCKINCKGIKRQKHAIIIIEGYEHERDYDG